MIIDVKQLLSDVAVSTRLSEGSEGVRKILRNVMKFEPVPLHELSRIVKIPVPIVSAVRRELERKGIFERKSGIVLTEQGRCLVGSLGIKPGGPQRLDGRYKFPDWLIPIADNFGEIQRGRPEPNYKLDQSHCNAATAVLRAAYLYDSDALEGRDIVFIGDDDLTSLAICLLSIEYGLDMGNIIVLDIDNRLLDFVSESAKSLDRVVNTQRYDFREGIPEDIMNGSDVFFTDPPYTINGLRLFVSRGVEVLDTGPGKMGFVSFASKSPSETLAVHEVFSEMGLAVQEVIPSFNSYVGAQVHAGSSSLIRCLTTPRTKAVPIGNMTQIYTADRNIIQ